jgi:hypothetical protein
MEVKKTIDLAQAVLMGCGGLLLVLGAIVWTGRGDALIGVHVALGIVLVLTLWTLVLIAARSGVPSRILAVAVTWSLLVVALGMAQDRLAPGRWHWTIQVVHLAISMGVVAWGRRLVFLIRRSQSMSPALVSGSLTAES